MSRILLVFPLFALLSALALLLDGKHRGLVCAKCLKPPVRGVRLPAALAGWFAFSSVGLWTLFYAITRVSVNRGRLDIPGILGSLAFILPGQIVLAMGLVGRRIRAREAASVVAYKQGDPCLFCRTPLERTGNYLYCPNCDIRVLE